MIYTNQNLYQTNYRSGRTVVGLSSPSSHQKTPTDLLPTPQLPLHHQRSRLPEYGAPLPKRLTPWLGDAKAAAEPVELSDAPVAAQR